MQKITIDYLKEDANFLLSTCPSAVASYMRTHANNCTNYVGWVQAFMDEIVLRVFAYRDTKTYGFEWTEVERRSPALDTVVRRNCYFLSMGGWKVVYRRQDVKSGGGYYGYGYEYFESSQFNKWYQELKPMGVGIMILNYNAIFELDKYKYCAYPGGFNLIEYLKLYEKYKEVEYFGKAGIYPTTKLIQKAKKDKKFVRFLLNNNSRELNVYGVSTVICAYEKNMSLEDAEEYMSLKREAERHTSFAKGCKEIDRIKMYQWILDNKDVGFSSYADYFVAIKELGLDLTDTKNVYPRDFKRMHDLRIDEYSSLKAHRREKENAELNLRFMDATSQYKPYEIHEGKYSVILPRGIGDLVVEGDTLHHCVGKMGYDVKVADGKSIIAFIRVTDKIDEPFVTAEYRMESHKVAQCYADHNAKPSEEIIQLANRWGELVTEGIKNVARQQKAAVV